MKLWKLFTLLLTPFLLINCQKGGDEAELKKTVHGYPYVFHIDKEGETPVEGQYVLYQYKIMVDDSVFNDSHGGLQIPRLEWPAQSDVEGNPAPIMDALRMMSPGDSLVIMLSLDTLRKQNANVPAGDFIDYHITMVDLLSEDDYREYSAAEQERISAMRSEIKEKLPEMRDYTLQILKDYKEGKLDDGLDTLQGGVLLYFHEKGEMPPPSRGDAIFTLYYGWIIDSETEFDNAYSRGVPFRWVYKGRMPVIPAWDLAFPYIPKGSKVSMFIPSELAYGEEGFQGRIGPNEDLYFYIDYLERQR